MSPPLLPRDDFQRAPPHARGSQAPRRLAIKLYKSNRLLQASRLGGDLLESLAEFLASKNVINRPERYESIGARGETIDLRRHGGERASWQGRPARVKKFDPNAGRRPPTAPVLKKRTVFKLFSDLLSGRNSGRLSALTKLLRTPIFLAALFSSALVASLFILYTLSFHHCQARASVDLVGGAEVSAAPTHWRHHINSRQLDAADESESASRRVATECGSFQGVPEGRALKFEGIPYASPPIRSRRWRKPRPIWLDAELCPAGPRQRLAAAKQATPLQHCVQFSPFNHRVSGSEDCLHLDIYTPSKLAATVNGSSEPAERLPVMVYIHGGFLVFGSNGRAEPKMAGRANLLRARPSGHLASELNVVLVAPNYRLQALGFMALKELALGNGMEGSEGNYGLWDQLAALRWVRRNIAQFGGEPRNVILFGPDSSSSLPLALLSRRAAQNRLANHNAEMENNNDDAGQLFHAVWLANPTVYYELPYELANQHYARLIKSQSVCSSALSNSSGAPTGKAGSVVGRRAAELADWRDTLNGLRRAQGDASNARRLIDCLIGLTGEQVVREYLGHDDPAFRLDDENSLPIRNIFPDQFVTLDEQLVQDSFPFLRPAERAAGTAVDFLVGSTAQAVAFWPCPRNLERWSWQDFRHYVATSLNSFDQDTFERASELYGMRDCQTNASAAPCASPAETYLTMVSDIRQVCPAHELSKSLRLNERVGSLERYIVEWRPSSQLAQSLATSEEAERPRSDRETCSKPGCDRGPAGRGLQYAFHYWDLLALFGFEFDSRLKPDERDLEFQRHVRSMARRLAWRSRRPVRTNKSGQDAGDASAPNHSRQQANEQAESAWRSTLFTRDGQVVTRSDGMARASAEAASAYETPACRMWQQSLRQSYAWIG